MGRSLLALIVEDSVDDFDLIVDELRAGGFDATAERVQTAEDMRAALARVDWDIVIADHSLPRFSAPAALALTRAHDPDLPFIVVSGTIRDEQAVAAMKAGAQDYVLKGNLARLAPAVARELHEATQRRSRREAELRLRYLRTLSHDLRSPLNAILGFGQLLESGASGPLNERQRSQVSDILGAAHHMLDLVTGLVDLSRLDAGAYALEIEVVDLGELIATTSRGFEVAAAARGIALSIAVPSVPIILASDPRALRQVLENLLGNAMKFTARGSVLVSARPSGATVEIAVQDTGAGIPPEEIERLFGEYEQLRTPGSSSNGGVGLGLAIVQRLVRLLGGSIAVDSKPGEGSVFTVALPLEATAGTP